MQWAVYHLLPVHMLAVVEKVVCQSYAKQHGYFDALGCNLAGSSLTGAVSDGRETVLIQLPNGNPRSPQGIQIDHRSDTCLYVH
jgi:hypothetical protein